MTTYASRIMVAYPSCDYRQLVKRLYHLQERIDDEQLGKELLRYEERAAIGEYERGMSREDSERCAVTLVWDE